VVVEPVSTTDEERFQSLMQAHHCLGALPKIGETRWYTACWQRDWVALYREVLRCLVEGLQWLSDPSAQPTAVGKYDPCTAAVILK